MHRDFARTPGAIVHDDPDLLWFTVPQTNSWMNGASRCNLGDEVDARIDVVVAAAQALDVALSWHQTPTSQPISLVERLKDRGFEPSVEPGMAVATTASFERSPSELVVRAVNDSAGVLDWVNTFDRAFDGEPRDHAHPWLHAFAALYLAKSSPGQLCIGYLDDEPVATALAFVGGGAVGLYGIGTVPEHRGRGYGAALTVAAINWGRSQGAALAVLEATEPGFPVYERLGFRTQFETTTWYLDPNDARVQPRTA